MKVYNYDKNGEFINESIADESPLEPGVYLVPANSTTEPPPKQKEGSISIFENDSWTVKTIRNNSILTKKGGDTTTKKKEYTQEELNNLTLQIAVKLGVI